MRQYPRYGGSLFNQFPYDKHRALPYTGKRLRGCPTDMGAGDKPMKNQHPSGRLCRRQERVVLAIRKDACNQPDAGIRADDSREKTGTDTLRICLTLQ